jgi:1-phosphofructokinase
VIVTVTANPSVDRTVEVDRLEAGGVMRARASRVDAGGKGVNVARALAAHGHRAVAVVVAGGAEGSHLLSLLSGPAIPAALEVRPVIVAGSIRSNVTIVDAAGTTTKLNESGPTLSPDELAELAGTTAHAAAANSAEWVVLSGSLPPGVPATWYAGQVADLAPIGVRVAVDTSGEALAEAASAGPDLIKPNREELAELTGRHVDGPAEAAAAARLLLDKGVKAVLVSLGSDGAVLVDDDGAWHASAPVLNPRSSVGAGDALLAGFLASGGTGRRALAEAVAWGSAAVTLPGSRMPTATDIDRQGIHLTRLEEA